LCWFRCAKVKNSCSNINGESTNISLDYELPLYPKRTRRGGTCYYREWYPYCDIYVVKPRNPFKDESSSIILDKEISREELLKLDKRFKKR
jgi:hypothetical protein